MGDLGLENIEDLPSVVGHARIAITPLTFLIRFQDGDGVGSMSGTCAAGLLAVKVGQSGGLRALGRDQDGVTHGVKVRLSLHVQTSSEQPVLSAHILHIAVDHGVDAFMFRLLSHRPSRLVRGFLFLLGGLTGKQIIIVRHALSLLLSSDPPLWERFMLDRLLSPSIPSGFLLRPLFLLRPYLLRCSTDRRTEALQQIRGIQIIDLFKL